MSAIQKRLEQMLKTLKKKERDNTFTCLSCLRMELHLLVLILTIFIPFIRLLLFVLFFLSGPQPHLKAYNSTEKCEVIVHWIIMH